MIDKIMISTLLLSSSISYASKVNEFEKVNVLTNLSQSSISNITFKNKEYRFSTVEIYAKNIPDDINLTLTSNNSKEQYFYTNLTDGLFKFPSLDSNDFTITINNSKNVKIPENATLEITDVKFFMPIQDLSNRSIIGEDNRKRLACYKGNDIYRWGLSSVSISIGGSGASIGSGNLFLTNHHVLGNVGPTSGEVWFNWHHFECDENNNVKAPLKLPISENIASGSQANTGDWTLFKLHDFDLKNSEVKRLFGGLKLSEHNPKLGDSIIIPQYGDGGLQPTVVAAESDGKDSCNIQNTNGNNWNMLYDCDTQPGSSGSSIISELTGEVVGVHYAGATSLNYGVKISSVLTAGDDIIKPEENIAILPSTLPINVSYISSSPFNNSGTIKEFESPVQLSNDLLFMEHNADYTYVYANTFDEKSNKEIKSTENEKPIKMWLEQNGIKFSLAATSKLSKDKAVTLKYSAPYHNDFTARTWFVFDSYNIDNNLLGHEIIKLSENWFDAMKAPFDEDSDNVRKFNINIDNDESKQLAFLASDKKEALLSFYPQQGPTSIVWAERKINRLPIVIENTNTLKRDIMYLDVYKDTTCELFSMNSAVYCGNNAMPSFKIDYLQKNNTHIKSGLYRAILPLQTKHIDTNNVISNVMIDINLNIKKDEDYCQLIDPSANEYPTWESGTTYTNETINYNGLVYKSKWWNLDSPPSQSNDAWELLSNVELPWSASSIYTEGEQVNHNGFRWQAKWWTKEAEPGTNIVWNNIGPASCLFE
ncbi:TPA: trypsin-like peptidase domain-containing protein [Photobacterium damselae]